MTLSEELYAVYLENEEPNFYSRVPHILDYLTYDHIDEKTGKIEIRRLSIYAKELYRVLKSVAGDQGACWQNRDKLAETCNMSAGQIGNCKKELTQKFHQLDGNPLIHIDKVQKCTVGGGIIKNKTYNDRIKVKNIWGYNNAFMRTRDLRKKEASTQDDSPSKASTQNDDATQEAVTCGDTNNNPINNPLFIEQQPGTAVPAVVPYQKNKVVFSDERDKSYNWLISLGFKVKDALKICMDYSTDEIRKANEYMVNQLKINTSKRIASPSNEHGYFVNILRNKYWEKKKAY
jgi:hypothetical protein